MHATNLRILTYLSIWILLLPGCGGGGGSSSDSGGEPPVIELKSWYVDLDGDLYGDSSASPILKESKPLGYVADNTDCDDNDSERNPGLTESYDFKDNDCDGEVDEGFSTWYVDTDGDGYGNPSLTVHAIGQPAGYVPDNTDCDDFDTEQNPGLPEVYDLKDNDCDGAVDEGFSPWYIDADGDGYGDPGIVVHETERPEGYVSDNTDCDDSDEYVYPGAAEICGDGKDNGCTGATGDPYVCLVDCYRDEDNDRYSTGESYTSYSSCINGFTPAENLLSTVLFDCNDANGEINPGSPEEPNDGIDQDCTGYDSITWYKDIDGDSYSDGVITYAEVGPEGYRLPSELSALYGDWDDGDFTVHPGAVEYCDGKDNDQNGLVDDSAICDGDTLSETINGVSFELVYLSEGFFMMGDEFADGITSALPLHPVTFSRGYYIGKYEVTQRQWQAIMGSNPSYFTSSPDNPVEQVSWEEIHTFLNDLNTANGNGGCTKGDSGCYYLPTEAQWEYAAKGGPPSLATATRYSGSPLIDPVGWYRLNSGNATHQVGLLMPNELGLFDMTGNVMEFVEDWYGSNYYASSPLVDPAGPTSGYYRVRRGGSFFENDWYNLLVYRGGTIPDYSGANYLGFRLAREP